MIYISIPVHEKPEVIVDQLCNFERFFPSAKIVLHLSKNANFSVQEFLDYINANQIRNTLVNPIQVETHWGGIIQAHIANIRYIISQRDAQKIVFHSSNDMLIMSGIEEYISNKSNVFHQRKCQSNSYWWVARRATKDSKLKGYFDNNIYASQIEGSMYEIDLLKELIDDIDSGKLQLDSKIFYPREEIIFSSFAHKKGVKPEGLPYIYSEIHQFDKVLFNYIKRFKCLLGSSFVIHRGLRYLLSTYLAHLKFYRIDKQVILKIRDRHQDLDIKNCLDDGDGLKWKIFHKESLFGVKRVERELNNPVRKFIRDELR